MEENKADWTEAAELETEAERQDGAEEAAAGELALTDKVLWLMEKISDYGYLTMQEIPYVFGNKTWAYKVVSGLKKHGLVADFDTLLVPRTAHYLTARGYRFLGKSGKLRTGLRFRPGNYNTFIFRHRMACAKVGLLLEKHPLVHEFQPEILLLKQRESASDKVCDGEFFYKAPGHDRSERVGLEVELTLKNGEKLDETFRRLGRRDLDQVWWICGDDTILRALRREVLHRPSLRPQRHFFALLTDFLASEVKAELMEADGALLTIDPAKPTLLPRQPEPPLPALPQPPAPVAPPELPAPPLWRPAEVSIARSVVELPIENPPKSRENTFEKKNWLRRRFEDFQDWFEMQCTPPPGLRRVLDGEELSRQNSNRRLMLIFAVLGILAVITPTPRPSKPGAGFMAWFSPSEKRPQPSAWRKLKPDAVYWNLGDIKLSVESFEAKGEQRRMSLGLRRYTEYWGGCDLRYLAVSDAKGHLLARWKIAGSGGVYGREPWESEPMSFRAPVPMRRFIITVGFYDKPYECKRWDVPVNFSNG